MKTILEQWNGVFIVDDEVHDNLDHFNVKDGEEFHVRLTRRKGDNGKDLLSAK